MDETWLMRRLSNACLSQRDESQSLMVSKTNRLISSSDNSLYSARRNSFQKYFSQSHSDLYSLRKKIDNDFCKTNFVLKMRMNKSNSDGQTLNTTTTSSTNYFKSIFDSFLKSIKFLLMTKNVIILPIIIYLLNTKFKNALSMSSTTTTTLYKSIPITLASLNTLVSKGLA